MPVSPYEAGRIICERGLWKVTNLALQKILYIAHMIHMGRTGGERLVNADFEAWDYGPVVPSLYRKVRPFGDKPIPNIFFAVQDVSNNRIASTLDEACEHLLPKRPGELVAITHWEEGAWAKNYIPGVRGIVIPDADILVEYEARTAS